MRLVAGVVGATVLIGAVVTSALLCQVRACTVEGEHLQFGNPAWDFDQDVIVRPAGGRPFRLTYLLASHLRAEIPVRPGDPTKVEVHDVITFTGTTQPLRYLVSREVESADGM